MAQEDHTQGEGRDVGGEGLFSRMVISGAFQLSKTEVSDVLG